MTAVEKINYQMALVAVKDSLKEAQQWCSDGFHESSVLYIGDNYVFTVGDNGDYEDYVNAIDAAHALANMWNEEDNL